MRCWGDSDKRDLVSTERYCIRRRRNAGGCSDAFSAKGEIIHSSKIFERSGPASIMDRKTTGPLLDKRRRRLMEFVTAVGAVVVALSIWFGIVALVQWFRAEVALRPHFFCWRQRCHL